MCRKGRLRQEQQKNNEKYPGHTVKNCVPFLSSFLPHIAFTKKMRFILYSDINGAIIALL